MSTALIERTGSEVDAIDLFCGYGGSSQGIHKAGATIRLAANHNDLAVDCHSRNFPDADHVRADLSNPDQADYVDPADLPPARFLWASPSCKFHSQANARKIYERGPQGVLWEEEFDQVAYANSERSRVTMICPLRYAAKHRPEIVVIENVVECAKWGPSRDGSTFRWWLHEWELIGYEYECLFLNSMFFPPCPQSRDRMYVVFWRKGNTKPDLDYRPTAMCSSDRCAGKVVQAVQTWKQRTAAWPLPRWGKYGSQYDYRCPDCRGKVDPVAWPAYTAIDWTNLGPTIGDRIDAGKGLADATLDRIRRGLTKFRGGPPIVIPAKSIWGSDKHVLEPLPTQTGQQEKAVTFEGHAFVSRYAGAGRGDERSVVDAMGTVVERATQQYLATEGVLIPAAGHTFERPGQTRAKSLVDPLFTQHTTLAFGFAHTPFLTEMRGGGSKVSGQHPVTDDMHAITAGGMHHGLASPAVFAKFNGGPNDTAWHNSMTDPFGTFTGGGQYGIDPTGLVVLPWVDQWRSDPVAVTEQLATVMTHLRHALASSPQVDALGPVSDEDLMEVRFRMLDPDPELRRGMAFADDYILVGNKTQKTAGLGNAVTPPVASWITEQCMETLRGSGTR